MSEAVVIAGDPAVLETALSALLLATSAAVAGHSHARVLLTASVHSASHVEIAVAQVGGAISPAWETRAFDLTWDGHPGGPSASLCMLAARAVAEAYGGRLTVSKSGPRATMTMVLPTPALS
jgi:hypothetical protein